MSAARRYQPQGVLHRLAPQAQGAAPPATIETMPVGSGELPVAPSSQRTARPKVASSRPRSWLAALLLAIGSAAAALFFTAKYPVPATPESLVFLAASSAFAALLVYGLFAPPRALPAVLASALTPAALTWLPFEPAPQLSVAIATSAAALGILLAAGVKRAR